jgi:hypothetical protein
VQVVLKKAVNVAMDESDHGHPERGGLGLECVGDENQEDQE